MCGFCGYFSFESPINDVTLKSMNNQLFHRGPDDEGIINFTQSKPFCGLGHRRLSIIDLAGGHQPMANEDETIWIAYNGEIYNHLEIRKVLESRGHLYKTHSDTETIVHLYEEYGIEGIDKLRGMFAFAIWDSKQRKIFLVRDRLGIKPLYYTKTQQGFVFASEAKSILKSGWISPQINYSSFPEYFIFGYVTDSASLFEGIQTLPAGHFITIDHSGIKVKRYWNISYNQVKEKRTEYEYKEELKSLFDESVKLRLMSDVPLGVFLSGGIDSSSIAAVMAKYVSGPLEAFSIGFERPYYSEAGYAREVANHIGASFHEVILTPDDFIDSIEKLIWHEDKPITWPSGVALYFVAKKAKEKVKVVLTGEGGDELFGGYDKYWVSNWCLQYGKYFDIFIPEWIKKRVIKRCLWNLPIPLKIKKLISHTFLYHNLSLQEIFFDNFYATFPGDSQHYLFTPELINHVNGISGYLRSSNHFNESKANTTFEKLLYTDIKTYLVELLMKQDKMSMAASLESRVPFLDHKLVEFAANVPPDLKIRGKNVKYIVKETAKEILPASIINRPKEGFPTPIQQWLKEDKFNQFAREILFDHQTSQRGYYNIKTLNKIFNDHMHGQKDNTEQIWHLINFELWNRIYFN